MGIVSAIILGTMFGFVLQRVGAADPDKIFGMLRLTDLHLVKVILLAIGFSSLLLFAGMSLGFIDSGHLSVKGMYVGVIIGGLLLGLGWAIAGFCPGTGVVAAGAGRKDAIVFIVGGLVGAGIFTLMYGGIEKGWLFEELAGGKTTVANTGQFSALFSSEGFWVAGIIAIAFIVLAFIVPQRLDFKGNE